jgi:hypothetical protein
LYVPKFEIPLRLIHRSKALNDLFYRYIRYNVDVPGAEPGITMPGQDYLEANSFMSTEVEPGREECTGYTSTLADAHGGKRRATQVNN